MNRNCILMFLLTASVLMSGCAKETELHEISSEHNAPMAATEYSEYTQMNAPETMKPTFPHKETEPESESVSAEENSLYGELYTEISQYHDVITFDGQIDTEEIASAMHRLERQHPEIFWINGYSMRYNDVSAEISLKVMNQYNTDTLRQMTDQLEQKVQEIISLVPAQASDYDKALFIHDYLVEHTEYDSAAVNMGKGLWSTAYGCLIQGSAVCQGYSQAFQILMNRLGMECGICSGYAREEAHAWNYIRLGEQYYWVDVTWDDPVSNLDTADWIHHGYFLIDNTMLARSRFFDDTEQFIPVCGSLEENYFVKNQNYLTEYYFSDIDARLSAHAQEGKMEMMFSTKEAYQMAIQDLFTHESIWNAQIFQAAGGTVNYQTDEDMYILRLIFQVNP